MPDSSLSGGRTIPFRLIMVVIALGAMIAFAVMAMSPAGQSPGGNPIVQSADAAVTTVPVADLVISNYSPHLGEAVTMSNIGTCGTGVFTNDNMKWRKFPPVGSGSYTQIATVSCLATNVPYSWGAPLTAGQTIQVVLTPQCGRLCAGVADTEYVTLQP